MRSSLIPVNIAVFEVFHLVLGAFLAGPGEVRLFLEQTRISRGGVPAFRSKA